MKSYFLKNGTKRPVHLKFVSYTTEYALSYEVASHKQNRAEYTTVKAVTPIHRGSEAITVTT